jgi:hypothetical protein
MVNLSVNVFGENLNLLEIGGRAEGFEQLVKFPRPFDTMLTFRQLYTYILRKLYNCTIRQLYIWAFGHFDIYESRYLRH